MFLFFGQVTQLILHRDEAGESKRFAFVTYAEKESATACLEKLEGLEVAGKALAVSLCQVQVRHMPIAACVVRYPRSNCIGRGSCVRFYKPFQI